jgi:antitoxin (DNA-binding transcriptional repressor) of toxin-antitoxin stability system
VDLVERGYTVDITNRGRLVAQMVPVRQPDSPLERWIAAGVVERAEEDGSVLDVDRYPATTAGGPDASEVLRQMRTDEGEGRR